MNTFYLTKENKEKLEQDLKKLEEKRKEIVKDIDEARAKGDLSENAEYKAAKEAQHENNVKMAKLKNINSNSKIINPKIDEDYINFYANVLLYDEDNNEKFEVQIVDDYEISETNTNKNKMSRLSPLGSAMFGKRVGDIIGCITPKGYKFFDVLDITYDKKEVK